VTRGDAPGSAGEPPPTAASSQTRRELIDFTSERQRHGRFVGREDVLARLDELLLRPGEAGWVVVTGSPGMGKSAVLSKWLARREAAGVVVPHHFVRRQAYDWDQPERIAASLAAQLEAKFPELCDPEARPEARLIELLGRVSKRLGAAGDLVVLVDGLDEAYAEPGENPLPRFLPHHVPAGIRLLCATRPTYPHLGWIEARNPIGRIDLDESRWAASNEAAVRGFWEAVAPEYEPPLAPEMRDAAIERAEGNVLHAVMLHGMLWDLPAPERRVDRLPRGLKALIGDVWAQAASRSSVRTGLGLLCAAQEALSLDVLAELAGWSHKARVRFLPAARQLLLEEPASWAGTEAYRPRHEWVRELMAEQLGAAALRAHHGTLAQKLATWPAPRDATARRYALRHALLHRIAADQWGEAWHLAADLGFLEAKCRELGADEAEADVARAAERCRTSGDELSRGRFEGLARALGRESHWLREAPEATAAVVWNRLRQQGWSAEQLDQQLQVPEGARFLRLRHLATRESPALVRTLVGHAFMVAGCAVSPDGLRVVSASDDRTLKVWDLDSGRELASLRGHTNSVSSCVVTPDGRRVVSASRDHTLKVWDLDSNRLLASLRGHTAGVDACAVTPDGRRVVSASHDRTLKVWDLDSGRQLASLQGHTSAVTGCAVTPDGRRVVSASHDHTLKVWDLDSGRQLASLQGHTSLVSSCAVTPDGRCVISASWDATLKIWDLDSGRQLASLQGHTSRVNACAVTPDGRRVVSASEDETLKVWDFDSGCQLASLQGHTSGVTACAVTSDGRRAVSASWETTLKIWDLDSGPQLASLQGHTKEVSACAVPPDGGCVVSASGDETLKIWDLGSGRQLASLQGHTYSVSACAVTPDSRRVVSASADRTLKVWDLDSHRLLASLSGHTDSATTCAVTPDGLGVVSASADGTLKVWDLDSGCLLASLRGHTKAVYACAVTPDGRRVVSASADRTLKVWDLDSGRLLASLRGHTSLVSACAVTPDGRRVVSASWDGTLKVWDLDSGRLLASLQGHTEFVTACALTPDGRRVVSASWDATLKVWDLESGACLFTHRANARLSALATTASTLIAGDAAGGVWFLDYPSLGADLHALPSRPEAHTNKLAAEPGGSIVNANGTSPTHAVFVIHANVPAETAFVRSELVPALQLEPDQILFSSELPLGKTIIDALENGVASSRVTILVLSPALFRDTWSKFGESLAGYIAVTGGTLVPLHLVDCQLPPRLDLRVQLDCRDPERRPEAFRRLRTLVASALPTAANAQPPGAIRPTSQGSTSMASPVPAQQGRPATSTGSSINVDIGILTIRDDEFRAVLDVFPSEAGIADGKNRKYALRHADLGNGERYTVAVLRQVEKGHGEAQEAARDLFEDLAPKLVLVVGIAGGLPSDDVKLGDVILSTRIQDFTVEARKYSKKTTYAVTGGPIAKPLAADVAILAARKAELGDWTANLPSQPAVKWTPKGQLYGPLEWQSELGDKLKHHYGKGSTPRAPVFFAGPLASSDRLVKDPKVVIPWLATSRDLLAVEMESGGVFRALRERCPMLAIRGISDIIGLQRADAWTKYACASAAAFTRAFLQTRPVPVSAPLPDPQ
jgi:WD40 repeat protein/nucleoside phosphorylase